MPKDAQMPICPISKRDCINEEIEKVENNANKILSPDGNCRCLPACTNIEYKHSITSSSIHFAQDLDLLPEHRKKMPSLNQDEFVRENVIGLHIYHKSLHFLTRNRGVVCVSNTFFKANHFKSLFFSCLVRLTCFRTLEESWDCVWDFQPCLRLNSSTFTAYVCVSIMRVIVMKYKTESILARKLRWKNQRVFLFIFIRRTTVSIIG